MYIIEHNPTKRRVQINGDQVAAALLHYAGGGMTEAQTRKAMGYQHTLNTTGQVKIGAYTISKPKDEPAES